MVHHGFSTHVEVPGDMHRDVVDTSSIPLQRPLQWGLNTIWAVDDFTVENGATRFVPRRPLPLGAAQGDPTRRWSADRGKPMGA